MVLADNGEMNRTEEAMEGSGKNKTNKSLLARRCP